MSQMNLLPWREEARQAKKKLFGMQVLAVLIFAFICMLIIHLYLNELLGKLSKRVEFLQTQLNAEQLELGNLDKKAKEQHDINTQLMFIKNLREENYMKVHLLDELVRLVPERISFSSLTYENNEITIIGKASSNMEITLFMQNISHSKLFKQPDLTEITGRENAVGEERNFIIKVTQNG